jgi:hypothetical protein
VNGPEAPTPQTITAVDAIITDPQDPVAGRPLRQPPTAIMTTFPWAGFLLADWTLASGTFGSPAKPTATYVYALSFRAPSGFLFDPALAQGGKNGGKVSDDGTRLTYKVQLKTLPR